MKYNCIVVDDEFLARKCIKEYIQKVPFLNLVGEFNSPLLIIDLMQSKKVDILFLDIQMPEISGLDFLKTVSPVPYTIFTTAFSEYALEGFEYNVVDYLLKPISFDRFLMAVNKVVNKLNKQTQNLNCDEHETGIINETEGRSFLMIKANRRICKIHFNDIVYIESLKANIIFHMKQSRITALYPLKEIEEILPCDKFTRIHNSFIVSVDRIDSLEGNLIEIGGRKLPVGRNYKENVNRIFRIRKY